MPLSFISSDKVKRISVNGQPKKVQLQPGHDFNSLDIGNIVSMQGALYTISAMDDNIMTIEEDFSGQDVFIGNPYTEIFTSPIRPAYYFSGNNTKELTFRYIVRRNDNMTSLMSQNASESAYITEALDVSSGAMLRASQSPSVPISTKLPYQLVDNNIVIDTSVPQVVGVATTTMEGTYSSGDKVDFAITFSEDVVVSDSNYSVPLLLLKSWTNQ